MQWRDGLFFQTTRLWIIPRRLKLWSSLQGRLEKNTSMKKYLKNDRHWYSTQNSNDSFCQKYGKSRGKLRTIFCLVLFAVWFPVWRHIKTPPSRLSLWRRLSSRSPIYVCRNLYCLLIHLNTWYIIDIEFKLWFVWPVIELRLSSSCFDALKYILPQILKRLHKDCFETNVPL